MTEALSVVFDFSPLHFWHGLLFLGVFSVAWGLLYWEIHMPDTKSHVPPFGGIVVISVITAVVCTIMWPSPLAYGLALGGIMTAIIGRIDEVKNLSPAYQLLWQTIISAVVVVFGWNIPYISHPLQEGIIHLDIFQWGFLIFPGSILAIGWLVFLMNTINWIDGIDGLATSIASITSLALIGLSLLPSTQDPQTLTLAIVGLATLAAFLIWNFPPARIYLGTTGSWFIGLYIGMIAMVGGGKIITTLLLLALPVLDVGVVIVRRIIRKQPPWRGDTISHLHHRLLAEGHTHRSITLAAIVITVSFAGVALFAPTTSKIIVFFVAIVGFILFCIRAIIKQVRISP